MCVQVDVQRARRAAGGGGVREGEEGGSQRGARREGHERASFAQQAVHPQGHR